MLNLEVEGYRYSRISNPTSDILEKRVALLEGGASALALASGQAALAYAFLTLADHGGSIVAPPTLYGTTHTLLAHTLRRNGVEARFAKSERAEDLAPLIDGSTRALYCESIGNPAGNICDIAALAELAHAHGVPLVVDNTVATPILLKPIEHGADIVVHSLTKFMGGHGVAAGRGDRGRRPLRLARASGALPAILRARRILPRPYLHRPFRRRRVSGPAPAASISAPPGRCWRR